MVKKKILFQENVLENVYELIYECKHSFFDVKAVLNFVHFFSIPLFKTKVFKYCYTQRKDYSALTKFLPPKHEYVVSVRLSEVQIELYEKYLNRVGHGPLEGEKLRSAQLFSDYQALMRIWTHPWVLKLQEIRAENKVRISAVFVYLSCIKLKLKIKLIMYIFS